MEGDPPEEIPCRGPPGMETLGGTAWRGRRVGDNLVFTTWRTPLEGHLLRDLLGETHCSIPMEDTPWWGPD
jgi:hypothetical protein